MRRRAASHALLIGVDRYRRPGPSPRRRVHDLQGCVADVLNVEHLLRTRLGVDGDRIRRLTAPSRYGRDLGDPLPSYQSIIDGFAELDEAVEPGDRVWIHFSGHGGRAPTVFPTVKGSGGYDASLIPADYVEAGRVLRDLELARMVHRLVGKGVELTLVLDSCHSGGGLNAPLAAVRSAGSGLAEPRGLGLITEPLAPFEAAAASRAELCADWRLGLRDLSGASGWLESVQGFLLLAACRANEKAYELVLPDRTISGAFTSALVRTLSAGPREVAFRSAHQRVVAMVHGESPEQTPQIEGEGFRLVLGSGGHNPESAILVLGVGPDRRARLNAGRAHGLRPGARLRLQPSQAGDCDPRDRVLGEAVVLEVGAGESLAEVRLQPTASDQQVRPGDLATLIDPGVDCSRRVAFCSRQDAGPGARLEPVLEMARASLVRRDSRFLEVVSDDVSSVDRGGLEPDAWLAPEILVSAGGDGAFELRFADQRPLAHLPPIRMDHDNAVSRLVDQLEHVARYLDVERLMNHDQSSPLRDALDVRLDRLPRGFDEADLVEEQRRTPLRPDELVMTGDWLCLSLTNRWSEALNVVVLDLRPGWGIQQIVPSSKGPEMLTLDPGVPVLVPLRTSLPESITDEGADLLKIIGTVETTSFRWLELPAPEETELETGQQDRLREARGGLWQQMERSATRDLSQPSPASWSWVVAHERVRVVRVRRG